MTDLAMRLTGDEQAYWAAAKPFVSRVGTELGVDIAASDDRYHSKTKTGRKSYVHKYSHELLEIIVAMSKSKPYKLEQIQK